MGRRKKVCKFCEREKRLRKKEINEKPRKSFMGYIRALDPNLIKIEKTLYQAERRRKNIRFRLSKNISTGISDSLRNKKNGRHWETLVNFTVDELMIHLEKQFLPEMSWVNYGKWEIDHIVPICKWIFSSYDDLDFKRCWHISNLQPLWKKENILKSGNFDSPEQMNKHLELMAII